LRRLAQGLSKAGEEVILFASEDWPSDEIPWQIRRIPGKSPMVFARSLQAQKQDFDCLFSLERVFSCDVYRAGDGVHAAWVRRKGKWLHYLPFLNPKHAQILTLERQLFDPAHTGIVIANSHMIRDEILHYYRFPKERIAVIFNGFSAVPTSVENRLHIRAKYGISPHEAVVLFVGTGWKRKGLRSAIQAVNALKGRAKLLVVGRGPSRRFASPHAIFAGPVSDVGPFYAAGDIFLLPTLYDPFSNACLEALSAGLPVITTSANGFSEVLKNQELGDSLKVGDREGLVKALERWLPKPAREKSVECRLRAASQFSMEENIRQTLSTIRNALVIRKTE
jgi:UDP-glucose:(heptosyl)LPS alpha-1,3-glucosyltransferase